MPDDNTPKVDGEKNPPTSEVETITIPKADHETLLITKKAHDAAGFKGRKLEEREEAQTAREETFKAGIATWQREKDQAEIDAVGGDQEKIKGIRDTQAQRDKDEAQNQRDKDLNKKEEDLKPREEKAIKQEIRGRAVKVAEAHNVDVEKLIEFTDGSPEALDKLAKSLPQLENGKAPLNLDGGRKGKAGASE
ncbi:hypothetical protein LCGC14_3140080, partial [marine sediment metagenome]